jgi:hypothetical protein
MPIQGIDRCEIHTLWGTITVIIRHRLFIVGELAEPVHAVPPYALGLGHMVSF